MKKNLLLLAFIIAVNSLSAQKLITRSGEIKFEASMPAFEEIKAINKTASCIFDTATGDFVALSLLKAFKFKSPLMEEHFNENYVESTKFPKSTFKGKILNFDTKKLSASKSEYDLEGDLTIHGITKKVKVKINLSSIEGKIVATSNFTIKPQDYKIEIPNLVKSKIAESIKINFNFLLEPK